MGDISGPKIRVGELTGGQAELIQGARVVLLARDVVGDAGRFHVSYKPLGDGLKSGAKILIDDGMMELRVLKAMPGEVECVVVKGGTLKEHKGVNFPGMPLELPAVTGKDIADLKMLVEEGVDYVAMSFVRQAADVVSLKRRIKRQGSSVPVIAKIERPEAIKDIVEIIRVSDGVMVARGDLGVEMPLELVPPIQKRVIRLCNQQKKPVITATQMLESMIWNPRPTRAEASDVSGAVFDGTDALMLSGETASGAYPAASAATMARIAREAERHLHEGGYEAETADTPATPFRAVALSACRSAGYINARAIICFTRSGATALLISKYRPKAMVIAATPDERVYRRMRLYYGVTPLMVRLRPDTDKMIKEVERAAALRGLVKKGETVVVTLGVPVTAKTNLMKIHRVGEPLA
jgi:pyruvate kinase